jgi:hypothetical protein
MECKGTLNPDGSCTLPLMEIPSLQTYIEVTIPKENLDKYTEREVYQKLEESLLSAKDKISEILVELPFEEE